MRNSRFQELVAFELDRATKKHGPIQSRHEGIAVVEEEFLEAREAVFRNLSAGELLEELVQVGAMAERMAEDCGLIDMVRGGITVDRQS